MLVPELEPTGAMTRTVPPPGVVTPRAPVPPDVPSNEPGPVDPSEPDPVMGEPLGVSMPVVSSTSRGFFWSCGFGFT